MRLAGKRVGFIFIYNCECIAHSKFLKYPYYPPKPDAMAHNGKLDTISTLVHTRHTLTFGVYEMAYWNLFNVMDEANLFSSRSQFARYSRGAYMFALRNKMLDSLFPKTNTLGAAITLALEVNDAVLLRKLYPAAARMLHRNGYGNDGTKKGC